MSTVTINVLAYGSGRVYVSSGYGGLLTVTAGDNFIAQYGERVKFLAVPNTGYKFVRFDSGSSISTTQNPFEPIVTQSGTIIARFEPITAAGTLSISNLTVGVSQDPDFPSSQGYIQGTVTGTGSGTYTIKVDGSQIAQRMFPSVSTFIIQVSQGQHTICANTVCRTINVGGSVITPKYRLVIKYYNLGWGTQDTLESLIPRIANAVNTITGALGYTFANSYSHDRANNTLTLFYHGQSPAVPIVAILAAIAGILFTAGFVVWSLSWYKEAESLDKITQSKADAINTLTEAYNAGKITATDYTKSLAALQKVADLPKDTDWSSTITTGVIIIAGVYIVSEFIKNKKKEK